MYSYFGHVYEPMGWQELVPELSVERFTEGVFGGLPGTKEAKLYSSVVRPGV
jgi:hypothetical protein